MSCLPLVAEGGLGVSCLPLLAGGGLGVSCLLLPVIRASAVILAIVYKAPVCDSYTNIRKACCKRSCKRGELAGRGGGLKHHN